MMRIPALTILTIVTVWAAGPAKTPICSVPAFAVRAAAGDMGISRAARAARPRGVSDIVLIAGKP